MIECTKSGGLVPVSDALTIAVPNGRLQVFDTTSVKVNSLKASLIWG